MKTSKIVRKLEEKRYVHELHIIPIDTTIRYFMDMLFEADFITKELPIYYDDAPYQRGLVWTIEQKQSYIINLFKGLAKITPTIALYYSKNLNTPIYEVVDGKQRINAIKEFLDNAYPILVDGEAIYWDNLQAEDQVYFKRLNVQYTRIMSRGAINKPIPEEYILDLFIEMNFLGTKMTDEDFNRVKELKIKNFTK